MAPRGDHLSGSGTRKRGPQLHGSIHVDSRVSVMQIVERIGSENNYAATAHQGSSPHIIASRGKMLRFRWERGNLLVTARGRGRIRNAPRRGRNGYFYFSRVRHPGNKRPVRYLTTPMHLYARMAGFRTTSAPVSRSRLP